MNGKIIGVGFQKTGTSTLREALKILGYTVKDVTPRALIPILKGNYKKILRIIEKYDALEDTPWYIIYKELDRLIPGSKFILTVRDEESWYKSVARHIGDLPAAQHEWIYGRGRGLPKDYKENTIEVYRQHNTTVLEYFKERPGDFLVMDFTKGDEWEKLSTFLGKDIPDVPFPHYNKTSEQLQKKMTVRRRLRRFRQRMKNKFKIWYITKSNLWPDTSK